MKPLLVIYAIGVALGAVLYLDVIRTRRSRWWLLAFWVVTYPALVAYVVSRRRPAP